MDWSKGEVSRIKTRLSLYCVRWSADAPHESRIMSSFGGVIFRSTKGIRFCKQEESARTKDRGQQTFAAAVPPTVVGHCQSPQDENLGQK